MDTRSVILLAITVFSTVCTTLAQKPLKESEIVGKFRSALLKSAEERPDPPIVVKGKMSMQNISAEFSMSYQRPRNYMEVFVAGAKFTTLQDDTLRWTHDPIRNIHKIDHLNRDQTENEYRRELRLDYLNRDLLSYKERGHKLKSLGTKHVDSVDSYALQLTLKDNTIIDYYLSTKTDLIYKIQLGDNYRIYSRYKKYGDRIYPNFISTSVNGNQFAMELSEVVIDANIPPSTFVIPQEAFDAEKKLEENLEKMIATGDSLLNIKDYEKSIDVYSNIIRQYGRVYRALNGRGRAKMSLKKYYDAVSDFNSALEVVPTGKFALNNRGLAKYYIGDHQGALEDYAAAIKSDSTLGTIYHNRGMVYYAQGKYTESAVDFARAVRFQTEPDPDSYFKYGITLAQIDRFEEALVAYHKAKALGLNSADLFNYSGVSYFRLAQYDSAAIAFKKALDIDKANLQYIDNYGNALYGTGDYENAGKQFEHYIAINGDNAEVHNMLGLCKYQEGDFKGAIHKFSKSIELEPKSVTYYNNRASAREQVEDYEGAIRDYSESISIYPNDAEIFYQRGLLKIYTSKKLEGCMDLGTANEMKHEEAKDAIRKNCN